VNEQFRGLPEHGGLITGTHFYNPLKPAVLDNKIVIPTNVWPKGIHTKKQWWDLHGQMILRYVGSSTATGRASLAR
jgi:hypothetical protein